MATLSVCCLTCDPGPRVAAILGPLREVADEIVVVADSRADEAQLAHYGSVADSLHRLEIDYPDRHLAWLHAQCSGDWIFRLDGDEVPAKALVECLPDLISDRQVSQYLFPRRWLHTDPDHWLAGRPWWPDYQPRLVRNDGALRFAGVMHATALPVLPARYLGEPIYHLDLLLNSVEERQAKVRSYRARGRGPEPGAGDEFNERFYLPELGGAPELARTPAPDRAWIAAALEAGAPSPPALDRLPEVVQTAEADRLHPAREFASDAYAARISTVESSMRMYAGERRALHFSFVNEGSERWPWDSDLGPPVRASYRLRNERDTVVVGDGPRTAFPCALGPGEATVVPLDVIAPVIPGRYEIEVDVVHEGVRWFESGLRAGLDVEPPPGAEDVRPLLPSPNGRAARLRWRAKTGPPKILHRIWLGERPLPPGAQEYAETWVRHHPRWEHRLWRDADTAQLVPAAALARCRNASERSNLIRFALLEQVGGVYVDTDVECLRPIDELIDRAQAFAGFEAPHRLGTAIIGSVPGHPALAAAAAISRVTAGESINSVEATGPGLFTLIAADRRDLTRFEPEILYPYSWNEPERRQGRFGEAYAVHHWDLSWAT